MALRNIKELINNKGYTINPNDRKVFEAGDLQTFFGLSETDAIEFMVYDINDNQLPQSDGELIRYISLTTENINDYFLIPDGTVFQKYQLPTEYFIDVERLLNEAGYANGIFKTQITLVNKRVGSEKEFDKLWISEISPSRTEVRLFPLKEGVDINKELETRFNIFINGGEFADDILPYISEFLENVKPTELLSYLNTKYGQDWVNEFVSEYKINNLETFLTIIYNKFVEASTYEFNNRISNITDINYGKPKSTKRSIQLSRFQVFTICQKIITEILNFYVPLLDVKTSTTTVESFEESLDPIKDILQRTESDLIFEAKQVELEVKTIEKPIVSENKITLQRLMREEIKSYDIKKPIVIAEPEQPIITPTGGGGTGGGAVRQVSIVNYFNPATGELVVQEILRENIK